MSNRLIGIVGYARTGKDIVADHLVAKHGFTRLASADLLRDVLYAANPLIPERLSRENTGPLRLQGLVDAIGWDEAKVEFPEVRRLLQVLGTEGVRRVLGADVWIEETLRRAALIPGPVVITDTRFPNEARLTKEEGGETWRIDRPGVGPLNGHSSETQIMDIPVDRVITNGDNLESLYRRVDNALLPNLRYGPQSAWQDLLKPIYSPPLDTRQHYTGGNARDVTL